MFPGLFKGDKFFWAIAWFFHLTLGLIILGHLRVFTGLIDRILMSFGMSAESINSMSANVGGVAGLIIMAAAIMLIIRRLSSERVREISNPADYIALLLILAILLTGNLMRFGEHFELAQTRLYFSQLLTLPRRACIFPSC
jgi:nitrate reductase gamma subunit